MFIETQPSLVLSPLSLVVLARNGSGAEPFYKTPAPLAIPPRSSEPLREQSTPLAESRQVFYHSHMNNTPDLAAILADYTAKVSAEERHRQEIRDRYFSDPAFAAQYDQELSGQCAGWYISDRH